MRSSLASLAALAAIGLPSPVFQRRFSYLNVDESTRLKSLRPARAQRRYDPKTGRSISAAEHRRLQKGPLVNGHGQHYGQSGNKLARKAAEGKLGLATLR